MAHKPRLVATPELDSPATFDNLMADRAQHTLPSNISLYELTAQHSRQNWMRSVSIDPSFRTNVEEYDGSLGDAYARYGAQAVYNAVCAHLAAVIPELVSRGYFNPDADLSYHEVCFYTHNSDYMPVRVLTFTNDGSAHCEIL